VTTSSLPPERFRAALESLSQAQIPGEVKLAEIPAPTRIASYAVALEASVASPVESDAASGSLVVLHEPGGHSVWDGDFRCVTVAKTRLEQELGPDPFLAQVAWSWLAETLEEVEIAGRPSGTVTRTQSESFGELIGRSEQVGLEVRASWTPVDSDAGVHLEAWLNFLAKLGGVEFLPQGVSCLVRR